jgi:MATE family multidrug resistance protein
LITDFKNHLNTNLKLAYPVMLSHLGQVLVHVADSMMVGRFGGSEPLAAAVFAGSFFSVFLVMGIGMSFAITPQVAQADGGNNPSRIIEILKHGLLVNSLFGLLLASILFFGREGLWFFDQPDNVVKLAIPYLQIISISLFPFMVFQAFRQFAEGLGYTKQAMYITIAANIINVGLNYVFIFGRFGFPPMGLYGAGLATLISRVVMALMMVAFVYFNHRFGKYWKVFVWGNFSPPLIRKTLQLGIPIAFQTTFEVTTFGIAVILIGWLGEIPLAAHNIAINMASITYMVSLGISTTAMIRVGNQLGRKDYSTMRAAAQVCFVMVTVFMSLMAVVFVVGRGFFPTMYIEDQAVVHQAAQLLIVAGLFQLSDGIQVVGLGALRGMSDVKVPTLITLLAYWGFGLPMGYLLGFNFEMGAMGVWYGLLAGLSVAAMLLFIRFNLLSKKLKSGVLSQYKA